MLQEVRHKLIYSEGDQYVAADGQHGNVLFLILIGIALFAALSFAVTRSGSGHKDISVETAQLAAAELIQYGAELQVAIDRLRIRNNCGDDELSFANPQTPPTIWNYHNPRSPTDFSCHVFHPSGGGLSYKLLDERYRGSLSDAGTPNVAHFGNAAYPLIAGHTNAGPGGSTVNADIILMTAYFSKRVCEALHAKNGFPLLGAPQSQLFFAQPLGQFKIRVKGVGHVGGLHTHLYGAQFGCLYRAVGDAGYQFFYVLKTNAD